MSIPAPKPSNAPAVVSLAAAVLALPLFIFDFGVVAWIAAITALVTGIVGFRKGVKIGRGVGFAIAGIALSVIILIVLVGMFGLYLTRPFRY